MCGRYVSASPPDELARYFAADLGATLAGVETEANYNVAPTSSVPAVRALDGHRELDLFRWGLVPFWAKDLKIGARMINARSETVATKPAFRQAFTRRRCLIPADGFYEWAKIAGQKTKQPYFIHRRDNDQLVFAGLWERWTPPAEDDANAAPVLSCVILTTTANETMAPIHDRMPVLLPSARWDDWLDPTADPAELADLFAPAPNELLELRPVSTMVNRVSNRGPELLDAVEPPGHAGG